MRSVRTLVYVHGGGKQDRDCLHEDLDKALAGRYRGRSRLAFYADICWPDARAHEVEALVAAIAGTEHEPAASAAALVDGLLAITGPVLPYDEPDLVQFAAQLYDRAATSGGTDLFGERVAVGHFVYDVTSYFCSLDRSIANRMRARITEAILAEPEPPVVVAHSLGTAIVYDVLAAPGPPTIATLVTVGSPMGFWFIQPRLRDRAGRPNPVPTGLEWSNLYDSWDLKVGFHPRLASASDKPNPIVDHPSVANKGWDRHDFPGYLMAPRVSGVIAEAVG